MLRGGFFARPRGKKQWVRAWHKGGGGRVAGVSGRAPVSPLSATLCPVELDASFHCPRADAPRILNGREFAVTSRLENDVCSVRRFGI